MKDASFAWRMRLIESQLPNSQLHVDLSDLPHERRVFHVANLKGPHGAGSLEAGTQSIAYATQKTRLSCGKSERSTQSWEFGSWYSVNRIFRAKDESFMWQI